MSFIASDFTPLTIVWPKDVIESFVTGSHSSASFFSCYDGPPPHAPESYHGNICTHLRAKRRMYVCMLCTSTCTNEKKLGRLGSITNNNNKKKKKSMYVCM